MERVLMAVKERAVSGKSPNRTMRNEGIVPGIVYHKHEPSVAIALNIKELTKNLRTEAGRNILIDLNINESTAKDNKTVVVKEIQYHPVSGHMIHVDFHQISLVDKIKVVVAVFVTGTPDGVKNEGGVVELHARELEVECLPTSMPDRIEVKVDHLKLNESLHASDIVLPEGVSILSEAETVIAQVVLPHVEEAAATEEGEDAAQPEVIGAKPDEAEAGEAKK
ncbi:MAG: large subunit ribosomal protein L25 [Candidatus Omnitrophota bacterium]|jgi:large subunit ribosomal protein L25